jgi:lipopolysaccharide transport system permease protein
MTAYIRTWLFTPGALSYYKDLTLVLLQKELKVRYKNSWLGYAWSVAHPLAFTALYFVVFSTFMRITVPEYPYAAFLVTGLFPWQWFANSVTRAPGIFLENASLIKKVRFPRYLLVLSVVLHDGVHLLLSIPVIALALLLTGLTPSWSWLIGIPVVLAMQALVVYGLAVMVASANLFFRDLERLTLLLVTVLFFLTPVIYPFSAIPERYHRWLILNPTVPLILCWQRLFLAGELPLSYLAAGWAHALLALALGAVVYKRLAPKFAEWV